MKIKSWSTWLRGYRIKINLQSSGIIATVLMAGFHLGVHEYNYWIQPILVQTIIIDILKTFSLLLAGMALVQEMKGS